MLRFRENHHWGIAVVCLAVVVASAVVAGCGGGAKPKAQAPAFPKGNIEFYVPHSAGGGSDIFARTVAKILEDEKLVTVPITVTNKPGIPAGMRYLLSKKGDGHVLMTVTGGFLTQTLTSDVKASYEDFTILPRLATDPFVFVVRKDSPHKTMKDLLDYAKQNPEAVKVGVTTLGGSEHVFVADVGKAAGVKFNVVPFQGGAEVTAALLGGHIDTTPANPAEAYGQIKSGDVRGLAVNTSKRLKDLPDVPTLKELGLEVTFMQFRGFIAPPDLPKEAKDFWHNALKKVTESKEFQAYVDKNMMENAFLSGDEFKAAMGKMLPGLEQTLKDAGILKK